jgi:hypothetical protein
MPPATDPIVTFYAGESRDHAGRTVHDILSQSDAWLESTHDYIQWLFPMRTASPVNPLAPTVTDATAAAFARDPNLRAQLARSFDRMARFYGFTVTQQGETIEVLPATDAPARRANWLTPHNHNLLRITRILTSLRQLGLPAHAAAFFTALSDLYATDANRLIGPVSFRFWKEAANA